MVEILRMKVTQTFLRFSRLAIWQRKFHISILSKIDRVRYQITAISLSTSDAVNKEVKTIASVQSDDISKMRGKYIKLTAKDRAAKNGIAAAIRQNNVQMHEMTCGT